MVDTSSLIFDARCRSNFARHFSPLPESIQKAVVQFLKSNCQSKAENFCLTLCRNLGETLTLKRSVEKEIREDAICIILSKEVRTFNARHYFRAIFLPQLDEEIERLRKQKRVALQQSGAQSIYTGNPDFYPKPNSARYHKGLV